MPIILVSKSGRCQGPDLTSIPDLEIQWQGRLTWLKSREARSRRSTQRSTAAALPAAAHCSTSA